MDPISNFLNPKHSIGEAELRESLTYANIPTLLLLVYQLTGNEKWLNPPYTPTAIVGFTDHDTGGLSDQIQAEVREAALAAILAWARGEPVAIPYPTAEQVNRMLSISVGEQVPTVYAKMVEDTVRVAAKLEQAKIPTRLGDDDFRVIIIGAGVSGICAALRMQEAKIPYTIIEKTGEIGGTWALSRYPGVGVDTPNHHYSFGFSNHNWSRYFCHGDELRGYLETVVSDFSIGQQIRFNTEVSSLTWDEDAQEWEVQIAPTGGRAGTKLRANVVISAVGIFNPPRMPDIKGLDLFRGDIAHTGAWPRDLQLDGRDVAVVGTGASAMQLVPAIVDRVKSLTVIQRTPQWAAPIDPKFRGEIPEPLRRLMQWVPLYSRLYRLRIGWIMNDRFYDMILKDPDWPHPDRSINALNDMVREQLTDHIVTQLGDRTDLIDKLVPTYPPFGKRILVDHGWVPAIIKPNVTVENDAVSELKEHSIVTKSGKEIPVDAVLFATGYDVQRFLSVFEVTGRNGTRLRDVWGEDDAKAYLGAVMPDFPNFFCIYGPNTQTGHGGSLVALVEHQMNFIGSAITQMVSNHIGELEIKREVFDDYNRRIDQMHEERIWTHPGMTTYFRNSKGRVVTNTPFSTYEFWNQTCQADLRLFDVEPRRPLK